MKDRTPDTERSKHRLFRAGLVAVFIGIGATSNAGVDRSFGSNGQVITDFGGKDDQAYDVKVQPNGKIVVAGRSGGNFAVARYLKKRGEIDRSFGDRGKAVINLGTDADEARSIVFQPDGKLLVAGASKNDFAIIRLLKNGELDRTFGEAGVVITDFGGGGDYGRAIALQPDGGFVVAGVSTSRPIHGMMVARYHSDGTFDTRFGANGRALLEDGEVSRTAHGEITAGNAVVIRPDGKILVAGNFEGQTVVFRLQPNGRPDRTFGVNGRVADYSLRAESAPGLAIQGDGSILVAGFSFFYDCPDRGNHEFDPDSGGFDIPFYEVAHIGCFGALKGQLTISRFDADGSRDDTFQHLPDRFQGDPEDGPRLLVQPDGKILVAVKSNPSTSLVADSFSPFFAARRYTQDGVPDETFGHGGTLIALYGPATGYPRDVALQADGKVLLAGSTKSNFAVFRFEAEGEPFAPGLSAYQPDNHIGLRRRNQKGDGVYSTVRGPQKIRLSRKAGQLANFFFTVENDGQAADTLLVRSLVSGRRDARFQVRQLSPANQNVTAGFLLDGFFLRNRQPGARAKFLVRIAAGNRAGRKRSVSITTTSLSSLLMRDAVSATVHTKR